MQQRCMENCGKSGVVKETKVNASFSVSLVSNYKLRPFIKYLLLPISSKLSQDFHRSLSIYLLRRPLPLAPCSSSKRNMELSSLRAACFFSTLSAFLKCDMGPCSILFTIPLDNRSTASNSLSVKLSFWDNFRVHFLSSSVRNMLARSWS